MPGEFRELPKESREDDGHTADFRGHKLDVYKLIALAEPLETETVGIGLLENEKNNNHWYDENGNWLNLRELLEEAAGYKGKPDWDEIVKKHPEWKKEIEKIQDPKTDYDTYPIILIDSEVADGVHKLVKAWIDGAKEIKVKRFEKLPEETIMHE